MPKFIVKKYVEYVSSITVEADTEDDAFSEARISLPESWSDYEPGGNSEYIDYDGIKDINDES
jgi:hypothetical protein